MARKELRMTGEIPECDVSSIPAAQARVIGQCVLQAAQEYFTLPGVQEEFERWLAERSEARAAG